MTDAFDYPYGYGLITALECGDMKKVRELIKARGMESIKIEFATVEEDGNGYEWGRQIRYMDERVEGGFILDVCTAMGVMCYHAEAVMFGKPKSVYRTAHIGCDNADEFENIITDLQAGRLWA